MVEEQLKQLKKAIREAYKELARRLSEVSEADHQAKRVLLEYAEKKDEETRRKLVDSIVNILLRAGYRDEYVRYVKELLEKKSDSMGISNIDMNKVRQATIIYYLKKPPLEKLLEEAESYNEALAIVHNYVISDLIERALWLTEGLPEHGDLPSFTIEQLHKSLIEHFPEEFRDHVNKFVQEMYSKFIGMFFPVWDPREKTVYFVTRDLSDAHSGFIVINTENGYVEISAFGAPKPRLNEMKKEGWEVFMHSSKHIPLGMVRIKKYVEGKNEVERLKAALEHIKKAVKYFVYRD